MNGEDGMVKIITGIRRCGKSYLLKILFRRYLLENGVKPEQYYLFADEIQMSDKVDNLDVYVTGSNSKMLFSDILTEFRGRSDEIRVHPFSFAEYYSAVQGDKDDAFLFSESKRYNVKGKAYFDSSSKYYNEDVGLRNARIGFRQQEMTHIMENIIYNELIIRGFSVDVSVVNARGGGKC